MSDTRFAKGKSGNPGGRPRKAAADNSAFDILLEKTLRVTQDGIERELTVEEALQLKTYQAALKGSRLAIRKLLKMIDAREQALAKGRPPPTSNIQLDLEYDAVNADEAMLILGILEQQRVPVLGGAEARPKLATWAVQAALSRPGGRKLQARDVEAIRLLTRHADQLRWPKSLRR